MRARRSPQEPIHRMKGSSSQFGLGHQVSPHVGDGGRDVDDPAGKSFGQVDAQSTVERRFGPSIGLQSDAAAQFADTDEAGHAFQSEAGHLYRSEAGHRSDLMSATGGLLPRIWFDDVSGGWIGQERVDFRAPNVAFAGFRR